MCAGGGCREGWKASGGSATRYKRRPRAAAMSSSTMARLALVRVGSQDDEAFREVWTTTCKGQFIQASAAGPCVRGVSDHHRRWSVDHIPLIGKPHRCVGHRVRHGALALGAGITGDAEHAQALPVDDLSVSGFPDHLAPDLVGLGLERE